MDRWWLLALVLLLLLVQVSSDDADGDWCVPGCKCFEDDMKIADCSNKNLLNVDAELLGGKLSVQALDLSNNSLSELPDDFPGATEGCWRILALHLAGNAIASISSHALRGLTSLERLDLSDNRLSSLPPDVLLDAKSLRALNLSGNKLKSEPGGWLLNAPHLTHLSLARCSFVHVYAATFSRLPALSTLDLSDNQLQTLDAALVFEFLSKLRRLELADNPLQCDDTLFSWLTEHNIEQSMPICNDPSAPKRFESMRMENNLPPVFAGLVCSPATENNVEREEMECDCKNENVSTTPMFSKSEWQDMWDIIPAFWALLAGFVGGIMLCVFFVCCWNQVRKCCSPRASGTLNSNESASALLIGESSSSLLFDEAPRLRSSALPPGTPPPPYRPIW